MVRCEFLEMQVYGATNGRRTPEMAKDLYVVVIKNVLSIITT